MRQAALHRGLERERPPDNVPGTVLLLSLEEESQAALPRGIGHRPVHTFTEAVENLSRREGVAFERGELGPATILALFFHEGTREVCQFLGRLSRPVKP